MEDDSMIIELHNTPRSQCRDDPLTEITIQGGDDIVDRYTASAKTTPSRKKWWKNWSKYLKYGGDWVEENRGYIMVVATVITTITFQMAASPPGGVWSQSGSVHSSGHNIQFGAGTSVLGAVAPVHYIYFMGCNAISFVASIIVTFLLISGFPVKNKVCMFLLTIALCTTLVFLLIAYILAVIMVTPFNIYTMKYEKFFKMQEWALTSLVAVITLVFLLHLIRFLVWLGRMIKKSIPAWEEAIHKLNC